MIKKVKERGKSVVAFLPYVGEQEYLMGSACTSIVVPPTASVNLKGFTASGVFLRKALDNIGIEPEVLSGLFSSLLKCSFPLVVGAGGDLDGDLDGDRPLVLVHSMI